MIPVALTIAGSDPSGGAGLQADLKTFHQHGIYGMSVVTLLTVQNTRSVSNVQILDGEFVLAQLDAVLEDIPPRAAKTGALGNRDVIQAVANRAKGFSFPLVVDPVMISKHGQPLMADEDALVFIEKLLPHTFLVTPNLAEAARLTGGQVDSIGTMEQAARSISGMGPQHVLVKGGHLEGDAVDLLWSDGNIELFRAQRHSTPNTHGTGCVTSAAITARLARGDDMITAIRRAKDFITRAIKTNPSLGQGYGPVNMLCPTDET